MSGKFGRRGKRGEAFQVHTVGGDDHFIRFETHVVVAVKDIDESLRNGDEALASVNFCKGTLPRGSECAGRLNVNLKDSGNFVKQTEDRRLWKPSVDDIGFEGACPLN